MPTTPFVLFGASPGTPPAQPLPANDEPSVERILAELREAMRLMHGRPVGGLPLVLFYSTVDTVAWLGLPRQKNMVERLDFIAWVEMYMQPGSTLGCTAEELYSARCAVVHTRTARNPKNKPAVRDLAYGGSSRDIPSLRVHIAKAGLNAVPVAGDALYAAFEAGARRFDAEVARDPQRKSVMQARLLDFLAPSAREHLQE